MAGKGGAQLRLKHVSFSVHPMHVPSGSRLLLGAASLASCPTAIVSSNHQWLPAVQSDIRREQRQIDKAIRDNDRLEKTAQKQIKEAAKRNDMTTAKVRLLSTVPSLICGACNLQSPCLQSLHASAKWQHPRLSVPDFVPAAACSS